jgi:hypothetical protein
MGINLKICMSVNLCGDELSSMNDVRRRRQEGEIAM